VCIFQRALWFLKFASGHTLVFGDIIREARASLRVGSVIVILGAICLRGGHDLNQVSINVALSVYIRALTFYTHSIPPPTLSYRDLGPDFSDNVGFHFLSIPSFCPQSVSVDTLRFGYRCSTIGISFILLDCSSVWELHWLAERTYGIALPSSWE